MDDDDTTGEQPAIHISDSGGPHRLPDGNVYEVQSSTKAPDDVPIGDIWLPMGVVFAMLSAVLESMQAHTAAGGDPMQAMNFIVAPSPELDLTMYVTWRAGVDQAHVESMMARADLDGSQA